MKTFIATAIYRKVLKVSCMKCQPSLGLSPWPPVLQTAMTKEQLSSPPITNNPLLPFLPTLPRPIHQELRLSVQQLDRSTATKHHPRPSSSPHKEERCCSNVPSSTPAVLLLLGLLLITGGALLLLLAWAPRKEEVAWTKSLVFGPLVLALGLTCVILGLLLWVRSKRARETLFFSALVHDVELQSRSHSIHSSCPHRPEEGLRRISLDVASFPPYTLTLRPRSTEELLEVPSIQVREPCHGV